MIYIALYKGTSAMSRAIRWVNWSEYSHAALITSRFTVIEAWAGGGMKGQVREVPCLLAQHNDQTPVDVFAIPDLTPDQAVAVEAFCRSKVGCRYDWKGVFRFVSRRDPVEDQVWFCSELVAAGFIAAGWPLLELSAQKTFPGLLAASTRLRRLDEAEVSKVCMVA